MQQTLLRKCVSILAIFLCFGSTAVAQLSQFVLQVTAVNESCTANGVLNFTATNTTAGATILYWIYQLPNTTTPIAVTSLNTFTGLTAGNYRVIATQSLGSESNTQQQDAAITDVIVDLHYTLAGQKEICGYDGVITVTGTSGTPVSYEIISGPVIRPLQASNVFNNLPGGAYLVRVFDNCGEGVVANVTLGSTPAGLTIGTEGNSVLDTCEEMRVGIGIYHQPGKVIAYPLTIQTIFDPTPGAPIVFNTTDLSGSEETAGHVYYLNYLPGGYTFQTTVTDGCGNVYTQTGTVAEPTPIILTSQADMVGCDGMRLQLGWMFEIGAVYINFISAPAGFNPTVYNAQYPGPYTTGGTNFYNPNVLLPNGIYHVMVTDSCGRTQETQIEVQYADYRLTVFNQTGCGPDHGSMQIAGYAVPPSIVSATILSAPPAFQHPLPYDASQFIFDNHYYISMNMLPVGDYVFSLVDGCGRTATTTVTIEGYAAEPPVVTITPNCSTFTLFFTHVCNNDGPYYLQKYYPALNAWGNPNFESSQGGISIYPNYQNVLPYTGQFRIYKSIQQYWNGMTPAPSCIEVIYNFEYNNHPQIIDVYSFACANNLLDVVVQATGIGPLIYRITTKNGQPFLVNNATSPIFLGLEPAVYNFQIQDVCGNILNSLYDISQPVAFAITPENVCAGQNASLTVPNFSFLNYQWWQGDNTGTILGMTNTLQFPNFNPATQGGIYHVRIKYPNPNSCIDIVLDYQMPTNSSLPNAGNDATANYCGSPGMLDLSTLLTGNFDTGGSWQEITGSGALSGNLWNAANISEGDYQFRYTVNGLCNTSDQATIAITIKPIPETPIAFLEQTVCDGGTIYLLATAIPFGTYQWSGPNGFASNMQNPVIEQVTEAQNGIYTVKAVSEGCESGVSSVVINASALPLFALESGCVNNQYTITASVIGDTLDPGTISYLWTGPNNYTNSGNPIVITNGARGIYTATAVSAEGCTSEAIIDVPTTLCSIPTGISPNGDTKNDVFDLAGFGVLRFKIYNRYGRMVFEQDDYTNQWHGQDFNGRELPDATYYYYIRLDTGQEKTGWVYVTR